MVFSTTTFLFLFLPAVLLLYYIPFVRKRRALSNLLLTGASIFFYAWGEPVFVLIMLASIALNWLLGTVIGKNKECSPKKAKAALVLGVVLNASLLFVFKYLTFFLKSFASLTGTGAPKIEIALPIGISFFTFQAMSYVIDVYRGHGDYQKNPLNVALYISFFPQLIAGPIVRYETIAQAIINRRENFDDFCEGTWRFMLGYCKKVLIANNMALVADSAFGFESLSVSHAWLGALSYSLQIFFDFSGYSDMAIGMGSMFGFKFLENFNYPYAAANISDFWRRWHISLGTWFRDYVYFPLGGSRVKKPRLILNLFIVWSLTGLWHGANWTFIIWGLLYFVLLTVEKLTGLSKKNNILTHAYTLLFVILGWVIFKSETLAQAIKYIGSMFGIGADGFYSPQILLDLNNNKFFYLFGILACVPAVPFIKKKIAGKKGEKIFSAAAAAGLIAAFAVAVSYTVNGSYNPFIYFNF